MADSKTLGLLPHTQSMTDLIGIFALCEMEWGVNRKSRTVNSQNTVISDESMSDKSARSYFFKASGRKLICLGFDLGGVMSCRIASKTREFRI